MTLRQNRAALRNLQGAFTLVEGLIGVGVMGILIVCLYTGMTSGFSVVRMARENLRATQVLQEKFETLRLYTWDQINSNGFIPETFSAPIYSLTDTNNSYQGTLRIRSAGIADAYAADLRQVTVTVNWNSGSLARTRSMTSFVARYGMQNYIW